jgi:hypothetical protein
MPFTNKNKTMSNTYHLIILILAAAISASAGGPGGLPGAWLKAPVGGASAAMGGAGAADAAHLFSWTNPALFVKHKEARLTLGGSYRSLGRAEGLFASEFRVPPRVGMGFSVLYRGNPVLDNLYDADGNPLENGSFSTLTFKIGLAYLVSKNLTVGGNVSAFYLHMPVGYEGNALIDKNAVDMGGFDIGARYEATEKLCFGLVVKNLGAGITINSTGDSDYDVPIDSKFPPVATLASRVTSSLKGKPFIWICDINGYLLSGDFKALDHPSAMLDNGFEWQCLPAFYARAGIGDICINGDMIRNTDRYRDEFTLGLTAGFFLDLSGVIKGLSINYALSSDKIWAGVENVCDFLYVF